MTKLELEEVMQELVERVDSIKIDLKRIKNYQYDSMCTDFMRSLNKKRAEIFYDWEKILNYDTNQFNNFDLDKYYNDQTKQIDGLFSTLEYLQGRKPIHNPY